MLSSAKRVALDDIAIAPGTKKHAPWRVCACNPPECDQQGVWSCSDTTAYPPLRFAAKQNSPGFSHGASRKGTFLERFPAEAFQRREPRSSGSSQVWSANPVLSWSAREKGGLCDQSIGGRSSGEFTESLVFSSPDYRSARDKPEKNGVSLLKYVDGALEDSRVDGILD